VSGVVVDTSVWVDFFAGQPVPALEDALAQGAVVVPPVVVAELISGAQRPGDHAAIVDLVADLTIHETPVGHWIRVGDLRREMSSRGVSVSTADAHVAQCALDRGGVLLSRDRVFAEIARVVKLRVVGGAGLRRPP
jgi:tRNA(fMet)-specific endonuclease VapC